MNERLHLLLAFSLGADLLVAQLPTVQWDAIYGGAHSDYARGIVQCDDGGYMVVGQTIWLWGSSGDVTGGEGYTDIWLVRLDQAGALVWQNAIGGTGTENGTAIARTSDGGFIITGSTTSNDVDVSGQHGADDMWVVKLDASGAIQWQRTLGGSATDQGTALQQTADGGYIVAGLANSVNGDVTGNHGTSGTPDAWVVKLDSVGSTQWAHCYGGSGNERANAIVQTIDGGYVFGAFTTSNDGDVSGQHGGSDHWMVKIDPTGSLVWQRTLGGSDTDWPEAMVLGDQGGVVVAGFSRSFDGDLATTQIPGVSSGGWVMELDFAGDLLWQHCYTSDSTSAGIDSKFWAMTRMNDGGYACAGVSDLDPWLLKIDGGGAVEWQLGSTGLGVSQNGITCVTATSDGYLAYGDGNGATLDGTPGNGWAEYHIVKLGPDITTAIALQQDDPLFARYDPGTGLLHVSGMEGCEPAVLSIADATGRALLRTAMKGPEQVVDLGFRAAGVYILNLRGGPCNYSQQLLVR